MFPQLSEALLHERVRDLHRSAEASRRARLARQGRRVAVVTAAHPVATLRSLTTAGKTRAPASEHVTRRAA